MKRFSLPATLLFALSFCLLACSSMNTQTTSRQSVHKVPATSPEFSIEGRIDRSGAQEPVLIWQSTRVAIDFEGQHLVLLFKDNVGQSHFDVEVDGVRQLVSVTEAGRAWKSWPLPLTQGRHELRIFKRSDAAVGHTVFAGIEIEAGAKVFAAARKTYPVSMLFFGDSITVGACNEDGEVDQWEDHSTHNNAKSYGALTAAAFQADYRNRSISGMGICEGYVEILAHQAWDALYPEVKSVRAPKESWQPDVVFVNLGENDISFSHKEGRKLHAGYTDGYVALLGQVRKEHPKARIVLLRGGMGGGATEPELAKAWGAAVTRIEETDTNVSHFVFKHWSAQHPRVADDQAMAAELTAWLRAQPWMKGR